MNFFLRSSKKNKTFSFVKIPFVILLFCLPMISVAQLNMELLGNLDYEQNVNDIWGYVSQDGTEYALVGTQSGVSVVSLADAANPEEVVFIPGTETTWRDMKTWGTTGYAVCDLCPDGMLVMDLSVLPDTVSWYYWDVIPDSTFKSAHNIFIDEFGYGYLSGTNLEGGQTIYFDAFTTPGQPQFLDYGPLEYAHDIYVRDNIMYASEINAGQLAVYDVSDKSTSIFLGSTETPSSFTHNAWLSDDSNTVFTTDEKPFASTTSYDVSDFSDIKFLDRFFSEASIGQATIPHNVHVLNDYLVISHYTDGVVVVDAQNPDNLVEVGNYDTFLPDVTGFSGCWGAYPFLPSRNILATDRQTGLYVLSPDYKRAGFLEGFVSDAESGQPLNDVAITILEPNRITVTDAFGNYKTGVAESGTFDVLFHRKYYEDLIVSVTLTNNEVTILHVALDPAEGYTLAGKITDEITGAGIADAKIRFESDLYMYEFTTGDDGTYTYFGLEPDDGFFPDEYTVSAGHWSHRTVILENINITRDSFDVVLAQGYEDNFVLDLGWAVTSDDSVQGSWVREVPIGQIFPSSSVPAQYLSPPVDAMEDIGNVAYITGNGEESFRDVLLRGFTRLTSPPIDMTNWKNPKVSFYHWFSTLDGPRLSSLIDGEGQLEFKIFNGRDTVLLQRWDGEDTLLIPNWTFTDYKILDYIAATSEMYFIFEAESGSLEKSFDESGIDFFRAWDASADGSEDLHKLEVAVYPNPFIGQFVLEYDIGALEDAEVRVYDVLGKELLFMELETTKGRLEIGAKLMAGVYFVELRCGGEKEVLLVEKY